MKPVAAKELRAELDNIPELQKLDEGKLQVKCFGHFEVFYKDKPLAFQRKQTKELFAYLVDREGGLCTSDEIGGVLWEDEKDLLDCDYYRMLEGDVAAINSFKGDYMIDYSWAEYTAGKLTYND